MPFPNQLEQATVVIVVIVGVDHQFDFRFARVEPPDVLGHGHEVSVVRRSGVCASGLWSVVDRTAVYNHQKPVGVVRHEHFEDDRIAAACVHHVEDDPGSHVGRNGLQRN